MQPHKAQFQTERTQLVDVNNYSQVYYFQKNIKQFDFEKGIARAARLCLLQNFQNSWQLNGKY